jgi:hypothetical protein
LGPTSVQNALFIENTNVSIRMIIQLLVNSCPILLSRCADNGSNVG